MSIAFDAKNTMSVGANNTVTLSHTCATGSMLFACITHKYDILTAKYNDVNMILIDSQTVEGGTGHKMTLYYLSNPTSGTHNFTGTFDTIGPFTLATVSYSGTNQRSALESYAKALDKTIDIATVSDNAMVVDFMSHAGTADATVGSGQTREWSEFVSVPDLKTNSFGSDEFTASPSTVTMNWETAQSNKGIIAVVLRDPNALGIRSSKSIIGMLSQAPLVKQKKAI